MVYDETTPKAALAELSEIAGENLVLVPFAGAFNYSRKCNEGFLHSTGDVIVLLNDDIEACSDGFLEQIVAALDEPVVGAVGARLLFSDGTIQHAGHVYFDGHLQHVFAGRGYSDPGAFAALVVGRETSGLTGACLAVRREVYEEVGGMCEELPINFNDVDFSLKLRSKGYRLVWLPNVELYHFESKSRVPIVHDWEYARVTSRWDVSGPDPYLPFIRDESASSAR